MAKKKQTKTGLNQKVHNLSEQVNEVRRQIKDELEQFERLQEVVKVDQNRVFTREACKCFSQPTPIPFLFVLSLVSRSVCFWLTCSNMVLLTIVSFLSFG